MKYKKQNKKAPVIIATLAVLIIAGLLFFVLERTRVTDFIKDPFYRPSATEIEQKRIDEANKTDQTKGDKSDVDTNPNVDIAKNTSQVPTASSGALTVTTLVQENGQVTYATQATDDLLGNGTCTITFTNNSARPLTRTTTAMGHACGPESIPENEFSILGTWNVTFRYFVDNTQVSTVSKIEIR